MEDMTGMGKVCQAAPADCPKNEKKIESADNICCGCSFKSWCPFSMC